MILILEDAFAHLLHVQSLTISSLVDDSFVLASQSSSRGAQGGGQHGARTKGQRP